MTAGLSELLATESQGVLATLSVRRQAWPFASIAPYALTRQGDPLLLLSDLAEHTRNVRADPRASLLVQDSASRADPQAGARVTLLGSVEPIAAQAVEDDKQRYVSRHPAAENYLKLGDFHLYVFRVTEARFINGFGDMGWLDVERFREGSRS